MNYSVRYVRYRIRSHTSGRYAAKNGENCKRYEARFAFCLIIFVYVVKSLCMALIIGVERDDDDVISLLSATKAMQFRNEVMENYDDCPM